MTEPTLLAAGATDVASTVTSAFSGVADQIPLIAAAALVITAGFFAFKKGVAFFKGLAK